MCAFKGLCAWEGREIDKVLGGAHMINALFSVLLNDS